MEQEYFELKITFKGGVEKKYRIQSSGPVDVPGLTGSIAGIVKMLMEGEDYPIITDAEGRLFALTNLSEILVIEARKVK